MSQAELLGEYRRAGALCLPCRVLPDATATASPTCWSRRWPPARRSSRPRCPASPSSSRTGSTGCSSRRATRGARRRARSRLHATAALAARLGRGRSTRRCASAFDGERARAAISPALFERGGGRMTPRPVVCVIEHLHRDPSVAEAVAAGRLHARRRDADARPRAGLARRRPARRRGVADRVGQVLLRARPRPRRRDDRRAALRDRRGSGSSPRGSAQVPPDHDSSDVTARRILNWIYAWQRFGDRLRTASAALLERRASPSRLRPRPRHTSRRSATTAPSSSTRC